MERITLVEHEVSLEKTRGQRSRKGRGRKRNLAQSQGVEMMATQQMTEVQERLDLVNLEDLVGQANQEGMIKETEVYGLKVPRNLKEAKAVGAIATRGIEEHSLSRLMFFVFGFVFFNISGK